MKIGVIGGLIVAILLSLAVCAVIMYYLFGTPRVVVIMPPNPGKDDFFRSAERAASFQKLHARSATSFQLRRNGQRVFTREWHGDADVIIVELINHESRGGYVIFERIDGADDAFDIMAVNSK